MIDSHSFPAWPRRGAFTLIEVMVSIAVAILLLLGVNQVFRATAQTTGAGLALSSSQQLSRTVKATLTDDLKNGAWDTGILIIRNEQVYAFRSPTDQQSAADPNDPTRVDPSILSAAASANTTAGNFPAGIYPAYVASSRSHRVDRIGFFARELLDRQTSPNQLDTIPVQANEAWVWYGHLSLPNNALLKGQTRDAWVNPNPPAAYFAPGAPNISNATNDNNFFATDFTLGRFATLLLGANLRPSDPIVQNNPDCLQFSNGSSYKPQISATFVTPLSFDSVSSASTGDIADQSLHDVAQDSISDFTARLANFVSGNAPANIPWYCSMIGVEPRTGAAAIDHRYQASPFIPSVALDPNNSGRISATSLALAAPVITRGCCHFIVEYAGNYLTQTEAPGTQADGQITSPLPSSNPDHIDFVSVLDPNPMTTKQYVRKIRWYGFPRDTNGTPGIQYDDVMPLRDVVALNGLKINGNTSQAPFEHFGQGFSQPPAANEVPIDGTPTSKSVSEYASLGSQPDYSYTCAWGPYPANPPPPANYGLPTLLRITVVFDDPDGRLGSEQSYEYIIDLRN